MTAACEKLHPFADGELPPEEAEEFRLHLATCADCQKELDDVLQLDDLAAAQPRLAVVHSLEKAREKRRSRIPVWAGAAVAAAAAVVIAIRPDTDPYALGQTRTLEVRLTHQGASEYRPYDVPRAAAAPHSVPLKTLAKMEEKGDQQGVATGYLLQRQPDQAKAALQRAPRNADTDSDRAAADLQAGAADDALLLLDAILRASPRHPQALWNRAIALRELGLPLASGEAFEQSAALDEPGWSREARDRAIAQQSAARNDELRWQKAWAEGEEMLKGAPPGAEIKAHPGLFRLYVYDAIRVSADPSKLAPLAVELGIPLPPASPGRARAAAAYAKTVLRAPDAPSPDALLEATRGEPDIYLGALYKTGRIRQHLAEYETLARNDPWFRALAAQEKAETLPPAEAIDVLSKALADAQQARLDYRAAGIASRLVHFDLQLHQVAQAWTHARLEQRLASANGEWQQERAALFDLANAARFRGANALARAYLREVGLRYPKDCRTAAFVQAGATDLSLFEMRAAEARAAFDAIPQCGDPLSLANALLLAAVGRLQPRPGDLARLHDGLAALRPTLGPGEAAWADQIEGWLTIETDRARGTALLKKAIAAADALPRTDENAQKARGYSYATLALVAAKDGQSAVDLLAEDARQPQPRRCAAALAVADERALVHVRGADGRDVLWFAGARTAPPELFQPRLTDEQLKALTPCEKVDVFAMPPLHGRPDLLPPTLAWAYKGAPRVLASHTGGMRELIIADVESPSALNLPRLAPWSTPAQPGRTELRGAAATPARALEAMTDATEIEIHAHGIVDAGQSDASLIVLSPDAGGAFALTAGEVRAHGLRGAPLVILAACKAAQAGTALHAPWSLPQAFLDAGARAVLASAGDIPDAQAREFFDAVRVRIRKGQEPAAALRDERMSWRGRAAWVDQVLLFD